MNSDNVFVAGLSLTTVGNLATPDIARDLMMEVDRHLTGGRPYLVKKVSIFKVLYTFFYFILFIFFTLFFYFIYFNYNFFIFCSCIYFFLNTITEYVCRS